MSPLRFTINSLPTSKDAEALGSDLTFIALVILFLSFISINLLVVEFVNRLIEESS